MKLFSGIDDGLFWLILNKVSFSTQQKTMGVILLLYESSLIYLKKLYKIQYLCKSKLQYFFKKSMLQPKWK